MKRCQRHPNYTGQTDPPALCGECMLIFFDANGAGRTGVQPTKIIPDKAKYSRKEKHKKKLS